MDPVEALRIADQAISDCDPELAKEFLSYYALWRYNGGFQPLEVAGTLKKGDEFAAWCQSRLETLQYQMK